MYVVVYLLSGLSPPANALQFITQRGRYSYFRPSKAGGLEDLLEKPSIVATELRRLVNPLPLIAWSYNHCFRSCWFVKATIALLLEGWSFLCKLRAGIPAPEWIYWMCHIINLLLRNSGTEGELNAVRKKV